MATTTAATDSVGDVRGATHDAVDRRSWALPLTIGTAAFATLLLVHQTGGHTGHDATNLSTAVSLFAVMSLAMMLPTAVPALATLRSITRREPSRWWLFLAAYSATWLAFAAVAGVAQWLITRSPLMETATTRRFTAAGVLLAVGLYQFSAIKERCLTACVAPMTWFMRNWRDASSGALRMGAHHGLVCIGCCWALMSLAVFSVGSGLLAMVALTVAMVLEKLPALGSRLSKPIGIALIAIAAVVAIDPTAAKTNPNDNNSNNTIHHHAASYAQSEASHETPSERD